MKVATLDAFDQWELDFWIDAFNQLIAGSNDAAYREVLAQLESNKALLTTRREEADEDVWDEP